MEPLAMRIAEHESLVQNSKRDCDLCHTYMINLVRLIVGTVR